MKRHTSSIAGHDVAGIVFQAGYFNLNALHRRVNIANGSARCGLFRQDVPRLERAAQFNFHAFGGDRTNLWKSKFKMRGEPLRIKRKARLAYVGENLKKILPNKMGKHEAIVKNRSPRRQAPFERHLPKRAD